MLPSKCRLPELPRSRRKDRSRAPLQVHREITFRLALQAGVRRSEEPALCGAVIFKLPVLYRQMIEVIDVVQDNALAQILRHSQADGISAAVNRHARAAVGVAQVAGVSQGSVIRNN